jgi:mRNA interferase MazF
LSVHYDAGGRHLSRRNSPSGGREQAGLRPAIIAQTGDPERLPTILIVPFTSNVKAADFPFTLLVEPDPLNNLDAVSVALIFQSRAIDKKRVKSKIGRVAEAKLRVLKEELRRIMGL